MDYCTMFPEGWWPHCCQMHDIAYGVLRRQADLDLMQCVSNSAVDNPFAAAASVAIAGTMYIGVRLFGWRFWKRKS